MRHSTTTTFRHPQSARLLSFWRAEYAEHGIDPQEPDYGVLVADAGFVRVTVRVATETCSIEIASDDESTLPDYRTGIARHMAEFDPALAPLVWSGVLNDGALPPNLAVGEVLTCAPHGDSWLRMSVRLSSEGFTRFASPEHWHFRLLRPADPSRVPVWPRLDARGGIGWPDGPDRLVERVFTIRDTCAATATVSFDIFRHVGGPTCVWASSHPMGRTVALMGPGAKAGPVSFPDEAGLLVGGDETAAPAILRALHRGHIGPGAEVLLLVGSVRDIEPLSEGGPPVRWLLRSEGATEDSLLTQIAAALRRKTPPGRLWVAASKRLASDVRQIALTEARLPKSRVHCVAYWS